MVRAMGFALLLPLLLVLGARPATAHPLDPSLLEIRELGGGEVEILWREPSSAPIGKRLEAVLPPGCRQLAAAEASRGEQRVSLRWRASCTGPLAGSRLGVVGLKERGTDALLRIHLEDGRLIQSVLRGDRPFFTVPERPDAGALMWDYAALGFDHILGGFDHLLFVFGLLFLVRGKRALLFTITAFTLGHSLTLSLAALGVAKLPSAPIEVAIALSIFVLALQLARCPELRPGHRDRRPWRMAAAFGLLHGFGFAGALSEAGLPAGEIPLALFSFNLGIEAGQLAFIAAVLLLLLGVGRAFRLEPEALTSKWALPAAYLVGSLSFFFVLERL